MALPEVLEPSHQLNFTTLGFEEGLTELVGRTVTLRFVDIHSEDVAVKAIEAFFAKNRNEAQARDALNALLVFYGAMPMTAEFFNRYFGVDATKSTAAFMDGVRKFQMEAIRLHRPV